ncbi:hypothetical protein [Jiella marina]|uniref:hypothetical protein n=1 Tax=Jiella sp. LLJ827 TaxID=2917712 RepID=UPI002101027E|nr:hypothetical protein [Jiella sp. LLJ827]MCQ0987472.1 hypothetical protein [Jiella sp. LLJ827]
MLQSVYSTRIEETAHAAGVTGLGGWFKSWTEERRRRKLRRDAFATLLRVDDDVLEDITGLRRDQVEAAARLPLDVDALERLQAMRRAELKSARLLRR